MHKIKIVMQKEKTQNTRRTDRRGASPACGMRHGGRR